MYDLIQYFTNIQTATRSIFLIGGLFLFLSLESMIPFLKMDYNKLKHAGINLTFTIITLLINLAGAVFIMKAVNYNEQFQSGLLNMISLSLSLYVLVGLVLMDLIGAWLIHWLEHKVRWMWKFHIIHHSDKNVDVTSGLRHHPGENIFRLFFTTLAVYITGASFGLVMLYQTVSAFFASLSHSNIKIPKILDLVLSYIFVTPNFHKIHHHYMQPYTDSNYGNIFSFWDHIFGTVSNMDNLDNLVYGLDTHMKSRDHSNILNLLLIPFQSYRYPVNSNSMINNKNSKHGKS